ncbi:unnamed protein product, partial [Closterium sp. NIES-54]
GLVTAPWSTRSPLLEQLLHLLLNLLLRLSLLLLLSLLWLLRMWLLLLGLPPLLRCWCCVPANWSSTPSRRACRPSTTSNVAYTRRTSATCTSATASTTNSATTLPPFLTSLAPGPPTRGGHGCSLAGSRRR